MSALFEVLLCEQATKVSIMETAIKIIIPLFFISPPYKIIIFTGLYAII